MNEQKQESENHLTSIFAVRTTIGREKAVQELIFNRLRTINPVPDLKAILISENYRGYVFIEAIHQRDVLHICNGVPHVKGKIVGSIPFDSIMGVIKPEKNIFIMEEGDIVEVTSGLFQNNKARIIKMPKDKEGAKEEVTVRLIDSDSPITVKIHADYLKLFEKKRQIISEYVIDSEKEDTSDLIDEAEKAADDLIDPDKKVKKKTKKKAVYSQKEVTTVSDDTFSFDEEEKDDEIEELADHADESYEQQDESEDKEEDEDDWAKFMM